MKRIGIFGGTFDPIHNGHLIIAENVREAMNLEKILFIPSKIPPLKESKFLTNEMHRLQMLKIAVEDNSAFEISEIEINDYSNKPNYTVDTLIKLREIYKNEQVKLYLIIGMDQLINLHKWKEPSKLFLLSEIIVINRPGYTIDQVENDFLRQVTCVPVPNIDISSKDIRFRLNEKRTIKYLVPNKVEEYIYKNKLYINN
jgi:nicotinate-nucleotide adenylyltransferase